MKELTLKEAKRLSLLKWKWYIKHYRYNIDHHHNFGKRILPHLLKDLPELRKLESECGLCEYYHITLDEDGTCPSCPLKDKGCICAKEWDKWTRVTDMEERRKLAQAIYDRIKKIKVE